MRSTSLRMRLPKLSVTNYFSATELLLMQHHALQQMVHDAILAAERRHLTIHAAIDGVWEKFEKALPLVEEDLS
jgi:hypothetical protein